MWERIRCGDGESEASVFDLVTVTVRRLLRGMMIFNRAVQSSAKQTVRMASTHSLDM
jgi:hypothetical protein